ncbi:NAD-dependent epimerase/dehydratase family protein [Thiocapsa rosea]|uniref:Nucleoside-diphosphate-sugar epimerase n=1 Tax=Thiocapsa rosea TaxID=69360 RepID=A0A495VDP7_9GAMM|nr:NAD(P)-dependent oxidoreductase [Thiocapsa rosea]RKT47469.1 nucleoside-diphosphate-sugar epimerase [Thiocapsa rosea]
MPTQLSGSRVLVTGGTGMIGVPLCRRLVAAGADVHAVARRARKVSEPGLRLHCGDLTDDTIARRIFAEVRPDYVVDLAAAVEGSQKLDKARDIFLGTLLPSVNLVTEACRLTTLRRFIHIGSFIMRPGPDNVAPCPYGSAKQAAEAYLHTCSLLYELRVVYLNPSYVYGPGPSDPNRIIPYLISHLLAGKVARIGSGSRITDWLYVEDCVDAIVAALVRDGIEGASIDIGQGRGVSVAEIARFLEAELEGSGRVEIGAIDDRVAEEPRIVDTNAAIESLGWQASTQLEEGLRLTVAYWREELAR